MVKYFTMLCTWLAANVALAIPIDVWFGPLGQSNAAGKFAPVPFHLTANQQHLFYYWTRSADVTTANSGFLAPQYAFGSTFASELSFGKAFANQIAVIKVSKSGSPMVEWGRGGEMYTQLQDTVSAALADLVSKGFEPTIRGGTWVQGEYDSGSLATAMAYEARLTQLITDLRTDYGSDFRFVFNQLHSELPQHWPTMQWVGDIRQAQENVANNVPNTRLVNVDDLDLDDRDNLHFSPEMQDILGQRFAKAMLTPSDLNYDGVTDGKDFLDWQRLSGRSSELQEWKDGFGGSSIGSIPEPAGIALLVIGLVGIKYLKL